MNPMVALARRLRSRLFGEGWGQAGLLARLLCPSDLPPVNPIETSPRIAPQSMKDLRPDWIAILERIPGSGLKGSGFPCNVLGEIMHNPDTMGPFLDYWVTCKSKMGLTVREQELVILRMACLYRSDYVWKHHVPVGREFGIDDHELQAVRQGRYETTFNQRETSLLYLTDEMVNQRTVSPSTWAGYRSCLRDQELVDLIHLVSQYVFFALMNNTMQVQIEAPLQAIPGLADPLPQLSPES
jgi:4-carboxymuconolactone decarboxylase